MSNGKQEGRKMNGSKVMETERELNHIDECNTVIRGLETDSAEMGMNFPIQIREWLSNKYNVNNELVVNALTTVHVFCTAVVFINFGLYVLSSRCIQVVL